VALRSQLKERRQQRHAAVARAIEDVNAEKLDEVAALLAHHWEEADEALPAARWNLRAAEWVSRSDPVQGLRHRQRVLALTDDLEASSERDELRLEACTILLGQGGWRVGLSAEDAEAIFLEGRELASRAQGTDKAIALLVGHGATLGFRGDLRRYYELSHEAVELIDESTGRGPAAAALSPGLGYSAFLCGHLEEALRSAERGLEFAAGDPNAGVETLGFSVWGQSLQSAAEFTYCLGDLRRAETLSQEAIEISRRHGLIESLAWGLGEEVEKIQCAGETAPSASANLALRRGFEATQLAEQSGSPFSRSHAHRALGVAHLISGAWPDAIESLEYALDLARDGSGMEQESRMLAYLSSAYLGANEITRSRECAEEAVTVARSQGARYFEEQAQIALARALRTESGADAGDPIERCLEIAQDLVSETGGRALEPQIVEERSRLSELRGDVVGAAELLRRAQALYQEIGASGHARRLSEELGSSSRASRTKASTKGSR
jgi:tetratricopeptide (TPR) repeat protein